MRHSESPEEEIVLQALQHGQTVTMEQLMASLPQLPWSGVLRAVDELSRRGVIRLRRRKFEYDVELAPPSDIRERRIA